MSSIARASPSTSGRPQRNASRNVQTVYRDDWAGDEEDEEDEDEDEDDNEDDEEDGDDGSQVVDGTATPDVSEASGALLPRHRQVAALSGISSSISKSKGLSRGRPSSKASNPKASQARSAVEAAPPPTQAESGFMADAPDAAQAQQVYSFILDKLRSHQWKGRNLANAVEVIPNEPQFRARVSCKAQDQGNDPLQILTSTSGSLKTQGPAFPLPRPSLGATRTRLLHWRCQFRGGHAAALQLLPTGL